MIAAVWLHRRLLRVGFDCLRAFAPIGIDPTQPLEAARLPAPDGRESCVPEDARSFFRASRSAE